MPYPHTTPEAACTPAPDRAVGAWRDWQAHRDAGRPGTRMPMPRDEIATLAAGQALLRSVRGAL